MRHARLIVVLIALLAPAAGRAAAATTHSCSTSGLRPNTRSITARGTSCATARMIVRDWFRQVKVPGSTCPWADGSNRPGVCNVRHWRCSAYHAVDGQTFPVTCTANAGRRRVRFINLV